MIFGILSMMLVGRNPPCVFYIQPMPHPKSSDNNSIMLHVFPCTPDPTRAAEQVDPLFYDLCDVILKCFPLDKGNIYYVLPSDPFGSFWVF